MRYRIVRSDRRPDDRAAFDHEKADQPVAAIWDSSRYHEYPGLEHGFGLGTGTSAEGWITDAIRFWTEHMQR
jgi:hypothetical protein